MRVLVLFCLLLAACGSSPDNHIIGPPNYVVPESIAKSAPDLQDHYYKLLLFTSSRFRIKPEFVFMDMDRLIQGQPHPHVVASQLVHVAYWKGDQLSWSGSVLLGLERGWMGFSERGYRIRLSGSRTDYAFTFQDGDHQLDLHIDPREGQGTWHELGDGRLYLYHCPMPLANTMGPTSPNALPTAPGGGGSGREPSPAPGQPNATPQPRTSPTP